MNLFFDRFKSMKLYGLLFAFMLFIGTSHQRTTLQDFGLDTDFDIDSSINDNNNIDINNSNNNNNNNNNNYTATTKQQNVDNLVAVSRCPIKANEPGVYLYSDKKLCNVYHECNCTFGNGSYCSFVKSNVCPIGTVFLNVTNKCEPIEILGCETSYLQWISSSSVKESDTTKNASKLENDYDQKRKSASYSDMQAYTSELPPEPVNITGMSEFSCPFGSNERYPDPQICNIFHVCVSRGDQTYDQPFLCPYGSIFRVIDSKTMYCDKKKSTDCRDKAFYRSVEEEDVQYINYRSNLFIDTNNKSKCINGEKMEDTLYCNTYHICKDGHFEHFICENQLLFNPLSLMCDYPINVACYNKQIFKRSDVFSMMNQKNNKQQSESSKLQNQKQSSSNLKQMNTMQNLINSQEPSTSKNVTQVTIYGVKIELKCPIASKNYLIPDKTYCNIFHHCHGGSGNIFMCEKGQAFDPNANGPDKSGVCNFEDMVNCAGKYILTEDGQKVGQSPKVSNPRASVPINENKPLEKAGKQGGYLNLGNNFISQTLPLNTREELVSGIPFDCRTKANGHWRDTRYCDVFHACIGGEQKKTYSCAQLGERIYFDETTKRCEFLRNNPSGCMNNAYFQQVTQPQPMAGHLNHVVSEESSEGWKHFIRTRESFSCLGRMDGFYASRWCNVFYRCFIGVKTEFLCPKMLNADRLWWVQHGSSQETPQTSAACVWPCETKKQCLSPGGSIIENGDGTYGESPMEADRIWRSSNCADSGPESDIFKIPDQEFSCAGLPEGNFYSSKYCNVFHRCTNGKRKDFQCAKATNSPYDLWWNDATNQCDWPCKVNCNKPVYGSQKPSALIQAEDRSLNEEECRRARIAPFESVPTTEEPLMQQQPSQQQQQQQQESQMQSQQPQIPMQLQVNQVVIPTKQITRPYTDENFLCPGIGQFISFKYCNVYYDCKVFGHPPVSSHYCIDGHFDSSTRSCKPTNEVQCQYSPPLLYPYISISETNLPEDVGCSNSIGYYIIHSNRYCNVYYTCDGRSSKPQAFRCYDRQNLEDGVYNRDARRCESKRTTPCQGEVYTVKLRYQSSPIDHTRLPDLQPLSCRGDQQYLAEHDKYCNLYHSCILGKYQMYACLTLGSFDKTSFFYYTNGDCAAPSPSQCGPNKSIYPYEKLFPNDPSLVYQSGSIPNQRGYIPVISPSISYTGQATFGSVSLKNNIPYSPECDAKSEYLIPHQKYCNIFYECSYGKLSTYACVDSSTGLFSGIFDDKLKSCKPFTTVDCPSNSLFNPEESNLSNMDTYLNQQADNMDIKYTVDTSFKTESNFSCMGRPNGYYESEWCNVFFRCIDGKRIDAKCSSGIKSGGFIEYDLWWEYQNNSYDPTNPIIFMGPDEDAKCEWPCKVKCNKPVWIAKGLSQSSKTIIDRDNELHPDCFKRSNPPATMVPDIQYQAFETENVNPSGFFCENDGTYRDPIFCNLFHICFEKERKTYHCKSMIDDHKIFSIYDPDRKTCVSREEGMPKCNGIIYDPNFMNLPAYRDLPSNKPTCAKAGVSLAYDNDIRYCDLFYWCDKPNSEPLYFYCDVAVFGKGKSYFNQDTRKCELSTNVNCPMPYKIYSNTLFAINRLADKPKENENELNSNNNNNYQDAAKNLGQPSPYMMQIVSGLLDPAPGYSSLAPGQFQTNFRCPFNAPGYYPNTDYCDIFHYCYTNGQYKTYVCASMQNQYQLWWSHQTEPGRRDNIFCDWPCNLVGPNTVCPPNKRVLMRDRQQVPGGIEQHEVLGNTCSNVQQQRQQQQPAPPAQPQPQVPQQQQQNNQIYHNIDNNWQNMWSTTNKPPSPYNGIAVTLHKSWNPEPTPTATPCSDWYISSHTLRCNAEQRMQGFAPDPKDCSKYYRCDQNVATDGTSTGYLMTCYNGLWWDQSRRMCLSPSEVSCSPYGIINAFSNEYNLNSGSLCRGLTCSQIGLTMKNYMKSSRAKPGVFYKCDGQCAIELSCPQDLVFDDSTQKCEFPHPQARMASLKAAERFILEKDLDNQYLDESIKTIKLASLIASRMNSNKENECNCTNINQERSMPQSKLKILNHQQQQQQQQQQQIHN